MQFWEEEGDLVMEPNETDHSWKQNNSRGKKMVLNNNTNYPKEITLEVNGQFMSFTKTRKKWKLLTEINKYELTLSFIVLGQP